MGEIKLAGSDGLTIDISNVTTQKIMLLRRQYLTYSKMNTPEVSKVPHLYIQYLKASLG